MPTMTMTVVLLNVVLILPIILLLVQPTPTNAAANRSKIYSILTSAEITKKLVHLADQHPHLVTLATSQQAFNLPTAGGNNHCTFEKSTQGCFNYYLTIQDSIAHPMGSPSYQSLPEVFLSGAVHGNERVGPTAVVQTAELLLDAASCEALPGIIPLQQSSSSSSSSSSSLNLDTEEGAEWLLQAEKGNDCRQDLYDRGISDYERKWLARLVTTRRIIILPTANAVGYDQNERTELGIDPNRDFPFDVKLPSQCMQTIAGRTINELFREHMFQIALTFHAGTEVVSYEWGAPTYSGRSSPDDLAQVEIGDGYARFAGGFPGTEDYKSGTMNDLVYPVRGGMEDWAYAGSWDTNRVIQCKPDPKLHGEYSPEKTVYNDSSLRAFNMLIETSNNKIPRSHLGTSEGVLNDKVFYQSNGHIARNIRLSLMAIDIVEPYVSIQSLNGVTLSDDVVPMMDRHGSECQKTKVIGVPSDTEKATVTWTVGGGFTVDFTNIYYTSWDNISPSMINCASHLVLDGDLGPQFRSTPAMNGMTRWHKGGSVSNFTSFKATFDISNFKPGDKIAVFATARLDQEWSSKSGDNVAPNVPPMSHIVNARSNNEWFHESAGKVIQGRKDWFSIPLTIQIMSNNLNDTVELSNTSRFVIPDVIIDEKYSDSDDSEEAVED